MEPSETNTTQRMNSGNRTTILVSGCFLIPLLAILGGIAGYWLYAYGFEPDVELPNTWQDLGSPPVEIKQLLEVDTTTIYVQTIDDRIFSCYHEAQYNQDCWNEVDSIPSVWEDNPSCAPIDNVPSEPEGVVDRMAKQHCIDSPVYTGNHMFAYILLADGTVKQWVSEPIGFKSPLPPIPARQSICAGCTIGLVGGLVILVLVLFRFNAL